MYPSPAEGSDRLVVVLRSHEPDPGRHARLSEAYDTYRNLVAALTPVWPRLSVP